MAVLEEEIARYNSIRTDLEKEHHGEWVVIHEDELLGTYASLDDAVSAAVFRFGSGPYLIRQIGAPPVSLPASVLYRNANAGD